MTLMIVNRPSQKEMNHTHLQKQKKKQKNLCKPFAQIREGEGAPKAILKKNHAK